MHNSLFTSLIIALTIMTYACLAQPPDTVWTYTDSYPGELNKMINLSDGNYLGIGHRFISSQFKTLLVKLSPTGQLLKDFTLSGEFSTEGADIIQTYDGGYFLLVDQFVAEMVSQIRMIKLDSNFNVQWDSSSQASFYGLAREVIQTADSGYAILAMASPFIGPPPDIWVIKLSRNFSLLWSTFIGDIDLYDIGSGICENHAGEFLVTGYRYPVPAGPYSILLAKLNSRGELIWLHQFGQGEDSQGKGIFNDQDNCPVISGNWDSQPMTMKFDSSGQRIIWQNIYDFSFGWGTFQGAVSTNLSTTRDDGFLVPGYSLFSTDPAKATLVKTDNRGAEQWKLAMELTGLDEFNNALEVEAGQFIACGFRLINNNYSGWVVKMGFSTNAIYKQNEISLPGEMSLSNSPNPFNPTTSINFTLPQADAVNLTIYDINGRQVATLLNGTREAGLHSVTFDGSRLASGIYLYQLQTADQTATGKMMLIK